MSIQDRKQREFDRRGQEILDAALSLFAADNWEQVTVEQIAQSADVGKGTIYKHFASKDEIYARLSMQFQRRILASYLAIDNKMSVIDQLKAYMQVAWDIHLSSRQLHRVFIYSSRGEFQARLSPEILAELLSVQEEVAAPSNRLIAEAIEQGQFPRKPLPLLLFGAQAAFWGGIQLVWSGYLGDIDRQQYLRELSNFVIAGLIYSDRLEVA